MEHVVIIGNGISGVTAARNIRKMSNKKITIISSETKHHFSRTALMYVYMGHMRYKDIKPYEDHFWEKNNINLIQDFVTEINTEGKELKLVENVSIKYDQLIIATGSKPNKFGWKGQDLQSVQGLYSKLDLDSMEESTKGIKSAVVVGGGLIGVEMAEMLLTRNIEVHFLVRENGFWTGVLPKENSDLIVEHFKKHHNLFMHYETELEEIIDDGTGKACGVITKGGKKIDCQFVGLTAGVSPNIEFIRTSEVETDKGVKVNRFLETNVKNVYSIGDCAEQREAVGERRPLEQVWYTGRIMGETVAQTICGNPTMYQPGNWFNSAKFFDVEYQTYGWVWKELKEGEEKFVWQHPTKEMQLYFVFDKETNVFKGINTFGIRLRHEIFDNWLNKNATMDEVLADLKAANFDPEFYSKYENQIVASYNEQFNKNITANKAKWWRKVLQNH